MTISPPSTPWNIQCSRSQLKPFTLTYDLILLVHAFEIRANAQRNVQNKAKWSELVGKILEWVLDVSRNANGYKRTRNRAVSMNIYLITTFRTVFATAALFLCNLKLRYVAY